MPAGAVTREPQALSGIIGRKGCVGGLVSREVKVQGLTLVSLPKRLGLSKSEVCGTHGVGVKSVDIMGNTKGEGNILGLY